MGAYISTRHPFFILIYAHSRRRSDRPCAYMSDTALACSEDADLLGHLSSQTANAPGFSAKFILASSETSHMLQVIGDSNFNPSVITTSSRFVIASGMETLIYQLFLKHLCK